MNTSKFVIILTGLVVMALLVGAVFLPVVSSSTTRTVTTIEENEEPGWLKFGYSTTDNYNFNVEIDGDNLNVGGQTGELYDMMVLSTDALSIVVDEDTLVAIIPNGTVDLGTTATVVKTSGGLNVNGTTYSAPLWSYYPKMNGNYAYFDHADLLTDNKPLSAWSNFSGVYTYRGIDSVGIGLTFSATITDGVIEGAVWTYSPIEDVEGFEDNPGSLNPLDPSIIDDPFEPGAETNGADPSGGTRIGDLYYNLSYAPGGEGTATVMGYASTIDWSTFTTIPDVVNYQDYPYRITKIDNNAFQGTNISITSLPDSITEIRSSAFYNCPNLALTSLPSSLTTINSSAFENCTNVALTSLPDGVTTIGSTVFKGCTSLALTSLPSSLTSIGTNAFMGCTNLALTSLPDGLTSIGTSAFRGCTGMTSLIIPDTVTSVGDSSFSNCTGLKTVVIEGDSSFLGSVFFGCSCGVIVLGAPTFTSSTFNGASITEVLNLGTSEITTTTGGLNADEVRTDIEALGFIAPIKITNVEHIPIESPTADVLNILPLIAGVGLLLIALGVLIYRRM